MVAWDWFDNIIICLGVCARSGWSCVCSGGVWFASFSVDFLPCLGVGPTVRCVFDYHCVFSSNGVNFIIILKA